MLTDWAAIAAAVVGTTDSPGVIAERYDVDEDEVEERLGEQGVETCSACGWWFYDVMRHPDVLCEECDE